jgi:hypothetical protein
MENVKTLQSYLKKTIEYFQQKISIKTAEKALKSIFYKNSTPESDINAEYILAHVLGIKRFDLKFIDDREMTKTSRKFHEVIIAVAASPKIGQV